MLHVWTVWTAPWQGHPRPFDLACLQLSVRLVASRGHPCAIFCDRLAARLLAPLGLPASLEITLDAMPVHFSPQKWAAAKIDTYRRQRGSFFHLDYDVFLQADLPAAEPGVSLTVQHLENLPENTRFYRRLALDYYRDTGPRLGPVSRAITAGEPWAYNCGVLAVHDRRGLAFMEKYTAAAWQAFAGMRTFSNKNCAFAEQMVLYAMAREDGLAVRCLLPSEPAAHLQSAARLSYHHMGGAKYTRRKESLRWILDRLSLLT